jgi:hypothetical protein
VQRWRTPKNKIATWRLTQETKVGAFLIGIPTANGVVQEVLHLLKSDRQFAILMPLSLVPELTRLENSEGVRSHDLDIARKVDDLSKIVLPSSAQVWLVNLVHFSVIKVLTIMKEGAGLDEVERTFRESLHNLFETTEQEDDWLEHNATIEALATTRSRKRTVETEGEQEQSEAVLTPAHGALTRARSTADKQMVVPTLERRRLSWKRSPREPLPILAPMDLWVGLQLNHEKMPTKYMRGPPEGELIKNIPGRPAELLGIPDHLGTQPRIIVPKDFCEAFGAAHSRGHPPSESSESHAHTKAFVLLARHGQGYRTLHIGMRNM